MKYGLFILIVTLWLPRLKLQGQKVEQPSLIKVSVDLFTGNTEVYWEEVADARANYYFVIRGEQTSSIISWRRRFLDFVNPEPVLKGNPLITSFFDATVYDSSTLYNLRVCPGVDIIDCSEVTSKPYERTIFLEGEFDSCLARVKLQWNDLNLWNAASTKYHIYSTTDKKDFKHEAIFNSGTGKAEIEITEQSKEIIYFVSAIRGPNSLRDSVTSSAITLNTMVAQYPDSINADFATYSENGPELKFSIDPKSELSYYYILRSESTNGPYNLIDSVIISSKTIEYIDEVNYLEKPYYYKLNAVNYCFNPVRLSNAASSILLNASLQKSTVLLNWNDYFRWNAGLSSYTIYRKFGQGDFEQIGQINTTEYSDDLSANSSGENNQNVCYYLIATENENNHLGERGISQSNTFCLELPPNIRFEFNAFIPGDTQGNNSFGPAMDFTPNNYSFQIFNRAGFIVYESTDPSATRWNGFINDKPAPSGAYTYIVQYRLNEKKEIIKGMVSVVY